MIRPGTLIQRLRGGGVGVGAGRSGPGGPQALARAEIAEKLGVGTLALTASEMAARLTGLGLPRPVRRRHRRPGRRWLPDPSPPDVRPLNYAP
ncbi:hypothetical protein AB0H43_31625 [Hamadaea sp. NPDC050747]|uniref:hypothetical protein n=1 Tax=Hamadaea sp. NPDC050747 TaxID=3155789 RepID=UPI00340630F9